MKKLINTVAPDEVQTRWSLEQRLEAGYRANAERDLAISEDWFPLEEEASVEEDVAVVIQTE
jgi:hypothetical protein